MKKGFKILQSGGLSMLQDNGRIGFSQYGIAQSGAVDSFAYFWSNKLLDNPSNTTVIEITLGALKIESQISTCIAVCGADLNFTINGQKTPLWQSHNINKGDKIEWRNRVSGLRCYLAIKGGFAVHKIFNSTSTNPREKIGGLSKDGVPLKADDIIPSNPAPHQTTKALNWQHIPQYSPHITLQFLPTYQFDLFDKKFKERIISQKFIVSKQLNRVGCRLQGGDLSHKINLPYSEGMLIGSIQIPPDGNPIIMLNDAPTIGGYPKIGTVCSDELPKLAQAYTGDTINFKLKETFAQ
jgi:biotin-dependent carboxylase-like uncharacterized protein